MKKAWEKRGNKDLSHWCTLPRLKGRSQPSSVVRETQRLFFRLDACLEASGGVFKCFMLCIIDSLVLNSILKPISCSLIPCRICVSKVHHIFRIQTTEKRREHDTTSKMRLMHFLSTSCPSMHLCP